ncbi:MAG: ATP-binding protein [Desulfobacterales bacterium]|nr:ATP-binding protein [Desulfobacterales bacterium]
MNGPANTPAGPPRVDREHPYLGLEYFREEDSVYFFGRAREIAEISRFVQRGVLTVLFGKSGLGKSSLINAGLCPLLREKNFLPVPIRVSCGKDAEDLLAQIKRNLAGAISACCVETPPPGDDQSLWEYLHRTPFWSEKLRPLMPVIILDQFEEVFIHGSEDSSLKSALELLADVIENRIPERLRDRLDETGETLPFNYEIPKAKVIISLRKDYLSDLEDLKHSMPSVMRNRYHLKQMSESQAVGRRA